jgi:hypothetical protein
MQDLITTSQAAAVVAKVSGRTCGTENIRRLAREGQLPVAAVVGNGQRLFDQAEVKRFAEKRENGGEPA